MPTIKRKVEMNLPQLIEWGWENSITNLSFRGHDEEGDLVVASFNDKREFTSGWCISKDDIFEIEVEEEITEDTDIPRLITRNTHGGYREWKNESVNGFNLMHVEAIYIPNDDLTLTLIWTKDKGLVE